MKIAFWGNFGTRNLGNDCTLFAMYMNARRLLPMADYLVVCNGPERVAGHLGVEAVMISPLADIGRKTTAPALPRSKRLLAELRDWGRVLRELRSVDMLVIPGTGILTDRGEGVFGMPYQMVKWALMARLSGTTLAFASVGTESMQHVLHRTFLRTALQLAHYRSYRDEESRRRTAELLAAARLDPLLPDLAFSLPPDVLPAGNDERAGPLSVAIGVFAVDGDADVVDAYVTTLVEFQRYLIDEGHTVRIVLGDAEWDQGIWRDVSERLERAGISRAASTATDNFQALLAEFATVDLVVATRFHNLILALLTGKPVFSVSYESKNDQLMEAVGMSDYCMPIAKIDLPGLKQGFTRLRADAPELRRRIREANARFRLELESQYQHLFSLLPGQGDQ